MGESQLQRIQDIEFSVMNSWGDLHNATKAARLSALASFQEAKRAEIAVDEVLQELLLLVQGLVLELTEQLDREPMATERSGGGS